MDASRVEKYPYLSRMRKKSYACGMQLCWEPALCADPYRELAAAVARQHAAGGRHSGRQVELTARAAVGRGRERRPRVASQRIAPFTEAQQGKDRWLSIARTRTLYLPTLSTTCRFPENACMPTVDPEHCNGTGDGSPADRRRLCDGAVPVCCAAARSALARRQVGRPGRFHTCARHRRSASQVSVRRLGGPAQRCAAIATGTSPRPGRPRLPSSTTAGGRRGGRIRRSRGE